MSGYDTDPDEMSLLQRIGWGIELGLVGAGVLAVLAFVPALIRLFVDTGVWWQRSLSFLAILVLYAFTGVTAGAIAGALWPWTRWWIGRRVLGILAAMPLVLLIVMLLFKLSFFSKQGFWVWFFTSVVGGFAFSFILDPDPWPRIPRRQRGIRRRW